MSVFLPGQSSPSFPTARGQASFSSPFPPPTHTHVPFTAGDTLSVGLPPSSKASAYSVLAWRGLRPGRCWLTPTEKNLTPLEGPKQKPRRLLNLVQIR